MVISTVSLQAVSGVPKKWERAINHRPARRKGKRIAEKRCRRSGRGEIDNQLASMLPSAADLRIERELRCQRAESALIEIEERYREAVKAAHKQRQDAIAALPPELRNLIEDDGYESWTTYYYVVH